MQYLWVAIGGALGSASRYWVSIAMTALTGPEFPWGTILINIVGSFVIGFFGALTGLGGALSVPADIRAFVMVGICGGFTTFSSFSLQTLELMEGGYWARAGANIALSVALCMIAVWLGASAGALVGGSPSPAAKG